MTGFTGDITGVFSNTPLPWLRRRGGNSLTYASIRKTGLSASAEANVQHSYLACIIVVSAMSIAGKRKCLKIKQRLKIINTLDHSE